jgi:hypothetical protein
MRFLLPSSLLSVVLLVSDLWYQSWSLPTNLLFY